MSRRDDDSAALIGDPEDALPPSPARGKDLLRTRSDSAASTSRTGNRANPKTQGVVILGIVIVAIVFGILLVNVIRDGASIRYFGGSPPLTAAAATQEFAAVVTPEGAKKSLEYYTSAAHIAGTDRDKETAEWTRDQFKALGIDNVYLDTYQVLLNLPVEPRESEVSIVSPASMAFTAKLSEDELAGDPTSQRPHAPAFHGYAPSGDITSTIVYANYGRVEDFAALKAQGVSVSGSIALVRYGHIFRGNKVENAQAAGAVGVIIYSDPADDGFARGPVYPTGPWRPSSSLQRGSVFTGQGDPLTPGYPATQDGFRLTLREGRDADAVGKGWALPTIPSIPIGYGDAEPLLKSLAGADVATIGSGWQGGLSFTYHTGPGPAQVRLKVANKFAIKTIWNVIATIPGEVEPDRWVVMGNHRDAWVAGAVDPSSGSASLMEVAKGLASLLKQGWKPRRSIVLASWDAEEYGLVGSTEFVEGHLHALATKTVAYLNCDESVTSMGPLGVRASPMLARVAQLAAKDVMMPPCVGVNNTDPATSSVQLCNPDDYNPGDTLYDFWLRANPLPGSNPLQPNVPLVGSGSDQTAFIAHAGIPAMDITFDSQPAYYAVYHSVYDSFTWMKTFGDPSFEYHAAIARVWGAIAIRLATDSVLPFDLMNYATALRRFENDLADHVSNLGGTDAPPPGGLLDDAYEPTGNVAPGAAPATPHTLDIARLRSATADFAAAAALVAEKAVLLNGAEGAAAEAQRRALNDKLMYAERGFIAPEGLPGRSWYKHVLFSPSLHNSYGATAFPAVSDALAVGDWRAAQRALDVVCHLLVRVAEALAGDVLAPTRAQRMMHESQPGSEL